MYLIDTEELIYKLYSNSDPHDHLCLYWDWPQIAWKLQFSYNDTNNIQNALN